MARFATSDNSQSAMHHRGTRDTEERDYASGLKRAGNRRSRSL